ncbi:PQQ-dependent sugar dehydrogenase [Ancylomarina euxinus]|uniref:PQQ-dependent sugar dehydrogenase n=1 Tax=Ancylomarina euxinus TaxID=2283627 RepID=A0A425XYG2_9BACT|nr:PQQ-dependent sugar dehydrogenase [Ancylomarina euxinus]MCZ4695795.1 PQQ-dependent sugar dehydrogenase [Ancylomarina euxinus]MUP16142.1 PQQ-dependent sugar dehydrogenase [Ancylomarina euxinus]RRG19862.1 PQQ-dependent sugar dehydrogenase [Ancylomarina euxinus]
MKISAPILLFLSVSLLAQCQNKQNSTPIENNPTSISYELIVDDLTIPWAMAFLPDKSLLITEKSGILYHFIEGEKIEIEGLPDILMRGQGGLMDIVLHPNYEENNLIYFSYISTQGDGEGSNTAIMRAKLDAERNILTDNQLLYKASPNSTKEHHFGSRITFDNNGYLYFTIGDRGDRDVNPQDINRDCGKVYRLYDDGRIPADNPFAGQIGAKEAIYSFGHRNAQGLTKHPETGKIWEHEHGPKGGDEINIIEKGKNYGWPVISYGINYDGTTFTDITHKEGMEQPIHYWTPSIAPSGMCFITSDIYKGWKGNLLVGSLVFQHLELLTIKDDQVVNREKLLPDIGRVRDVRIGPDGYIYVAVESKGIFRLSPK